MSRRMFLEHLFKEGFEIDNLEQLLRKAEKRSRTHSYMVKNVDDRWTDDVEKLDGQAATEIHIIKSIINYIENNGRNGNVVDIMRSIVNYIEGRQNENVGEARAIGGTSDLTLTESTSVIPKEKMNEDELVKGSQSDPQAPNVTQPTASGTNWFKCQHCGQYSSIKN